MALYSDMCGSDIKHRTPKTITFQGPFLFVIRHKDVCSVEPISKGQGKGVLCLKSTTS